MKDRKRIYNYIEIAIIVVLCAVTVTLDFVKIEYVTDSLRNRLLSKVLQQGCGSIAGILLLRRLNVKVFGKPENWLYLIPCLIIAIDNFQFSSYFNGKIELVRTDVLDICLFASYCLLVGLFEECIFRGIIFSVLAGLFPRNQKGLLLTFVTSSLIFGAAHLINGAWLQVGYTILTGGLFVFCLMKTKNIFCCGFIHGLYNFCGLLFGSEENLGLGTGIVFDTGTVITMLIVSVIVGLFVVYKTLKYPEEERRDLYNRLGIKEKTE
ncbi:MAG: CPBP family intramembrane metalloprotease [Clostridia bacterium]|nr:CPBP family intramembrane metalloprotease [Clostridia bacterium]